MASRMEQAIERVAVLLTQITEAESMEHRLQIKRLLGTVFVDCQSRKAIRWATGDIEGLLVRAGGIGDKAHPEVFKALLPDGEVGGLTVGVGGAHLKELPAGV